MATPSLTPTEFDEPIHPADLAIRDHCADWGVWPDDHVPSLRPDMPLGEQFARQVGPGESVEYSELFDLIREIARTAYRLGTEATPGLIKQAELAPPPGWSVFGTHVDSPVALEFYGEALTAGGMPMWERPARAYGHEYRVVTGGGEHLFPRSDMFEETGETLTAALSFAADVTGYLERRTKAVPAGTWERFDG